MLDVRVVSAMEGEGGRAVEALPIETIPRILEKHGQ